MTRFLSMVATFLLALTGCCPQHTTVTYAPPPPTRDEIVGTWVANDEYDSIKLDLRADGRATLVQWVVREPSLRVFACDRWRLDDGELYVPLEPVSNASWPLYVRARCTSRCLHAGISLGNNGAGSLQTLIRERDLEQRMSELGTITSLAAGPRYLGSPLLHDFLRRQSVSQEDRDADMDGHRRGDLDRRPWLDDRR